MDPLHDGTIFRLDKTALDRIRSPPQRTSPAVKPSAAVRISEPIVGIREQFEDLYRSTPNPLIALTSKGQHARTGIQHISGCREDSFNDDVLSECDEDEEQLRKARPVEKRVISTNNPDQKPSDKIASVLAPTNSIRKEEIHSSNSDASDRESIAESSSDKSVDDAVEGLAESIAKSPSQKKSRHSTPAHSLSETIRSAGLDEYIMSKKTPLLPPRDRYGTGRTPRSDIVRGSKIFGSSPSSVTPRSNLATGRLHKRQVQSDVKSDGSRALSVEAPSRKRGHGKNDSLSFLNQLTQTKGAASPAVSILRKNSEPVEKTQLENDTRSSTSSQERKTSSRALAQESRKQTVSRSSAPAKVSHDCYNPQHTLFPSKAVFGVDRDALRVKRQRGQKSIPSSPDGEENDTFSMKKKRAKKAVLMLIANEVRRSDNKSTAGAIASVTSRNLHVGAGRGNRRSNVDGLLGLGRCDGQLISGRTRSRVRESLSPVEQQSDRDNIGVTDGSASAREGVKKTTSKKQKEKTVNKSVVPNIVKSPTSDMTFSDGRSSQDTYTSSTAIWSAVEIKALRTAHKLCPITAPDFWEQVAAEVNRIVSNEYKKYGHKEGLQRSSDDCQLQWFKGLQKKESAIVPQTKSKVRKQTNKDRQTAAEYRVFDATSSKRKTKAQLRVLLEEAFVSAEDDIFDSAGYRSSGKTLSPTSLEAISQSTVDLHSPGEVKEENSAEGQRGAVESVKSNAWQANYVNKMKKTSKNMRHSSLNKLSRASVGKRVKKDRSLVQSGDAYLDGDCGSQVVNIKARISDCGRVNIALKGEDSDDANLEDLLFDDSESEISIND